MPLAGLSTNGPATEDEARRWVLERLLAREDPRAHRARSRYIADEEWAATLARLESDGLITMPVDRPRLTKTGREYIQRVLYLDVSPPSTLPYRVKPDRWRGELLCLGYRMSLLIRARRYRRIPATVVDVIRTMRGGELGRNNAARLLTRVPVVLGVAVRRMAHRAEREPTADDSGRCPCPVHSETSANVDAVAPSTRP